MESNEVREDADLEHIREAQPNKTAEEFGLEGHYSTQNLTGDDAVFDATKKHLKNKASQYKIHKTISLKQRQLQWNQECNGQQATRKTNG